MRTRTSPSTGRRYPLTMICAGYRLPRASVYAALAQPVRPPAETKRGPKTLASDAELVEAIRTVLACCPFHGEGYRKVRARLAHQGLTVGGKRVLRVMRRAEETSRRLRREEPPRVASIPRETPSRE